MTGRSGSNQDRIPARPKVQKCPGPWGDAPDTTFDAPNEPSARDFGVVARARDLKLNSRIGRAVQLLPIRPIGSCSPEEADYKNCVSRSVIVGGEDWSAACLRFRRLGCDCQRADGGRGYRVVGRRRPHSYEPFAGTPGPR
jgi:hypothetical protein